MMENLNIFQEVSLEQLNEGIEKEGIKKVILCMPPGTGKTLVSIKFSKRFKRILYIAHNKELIKQSFNFFNREYPKECFIIKNNNCLLKRFNFISIQYLNRNLKKFEEESFDCIIIDEAHHTAAKSYLKILEKFNSFFLGMTATPFRLDKQSVLKLYNNNIIQVGDIHEAIKRGYLTKFNYYGFKDNVDYTNIKFNGIEYNRNDLDKRLFINSRDIKIIKKYKKYLFNKKTIGFCNSIKHTERCLKFFRNEGIKCESITHKTPPNLREFIFNNFLNNDLNLIFTVNIFNEGIDFPHVEGVMLLRPSASCGLILQQIGRALRKSKNKRRAIILDFVGNHPYSYNIRNILSSNKLIKYNNFLKKPEYFYPVDCEIFIEKSVENFMDEQVISLFLKDIKIICREYFALKRELGKIPFEQDILLSSKENLITFLNSCGIEKLLFFMSEKINRRYIFKQKLLSLGIENKLNENEKLLIKNYFNLREYDSLLKRYKHSFILKLNKLGIKGICPRCLENKAKSPHHIIPRSKGGLDNKENIIFLCFDCHNEVELNQEEWFKKYGLRDTSILRNLIINNYF